VRPRPSSRRGTPAAVGVVLGVLLAAGCAEREPQPSAAEQVPQLTTVLGRVDSALSERRFAAARQQLKTLKAEVVASRDAGDLDPADAQRILDAIARLMSMLPTTTPSESASSASPSSAESSRPAAPRSTRPARPKSTTPTPGVSPSPTPSPTPTSQSPTSTPSPTPTDSATRDAGASSSPSPAAG
jgi:hypothetical protein